LGSRTNSEKIWRLSSPFAKEQGVLLSASSISWLRTLLATSLALPLSSCFGDEDEGEACLSVPEDGICLSRREASSMLVGDACGYDILRVTGSGTIKNKYPEGGYAMVSRRYFEESSSTSGSSSADSGSSTDSAQSSDTLTTSNTVPDGSIPMCCYPIIRRDDPSDGCVPGRPFMVDARQVIAPCIAAQGWQDASLAIELPRDPAKRTTLAEHWVNLAQGEHASIAAFSRLSLELMSFGAPAELIAACQRAALDEVRHAQGAFAIASAYLGYPIAAGPMALGTSVRLAQSLEECILAAVREGCINETLEVLVAQQGAQLATDPAIRAFLDRVCDDESRHAALSWKILAWGLQCAPQLRTRIDAIFEEEQVRFRHSQRSNVSYVGAQSLHDGVVAADVAQRVRELGRQHVILPLWQTLAAV
jgi:hypothetical protein